MTLPRKKRLTRKIFPEATSKGSLSHSPLFSLRILKKTAELSRFSVVVSSKVAPKAIDRNRLKRRSYEILKKEASPRGYWIVLYVKRGAATVSRDSFRTALQEILRQKGVAVAP